METSGQSGSVVWLAEQLGIVGAEDRGVVAGPRLAQCLDESPDLRRHHQQVASRLAAPRVAIRVRGSLWRQDRTVRTGLDYLLADPEPQQAVESEWDWIAPGA
jgi:hypothetical protein